MASNIIDKSGPVLANTIYDEGRLILRDAKVSLPEISTVTADVSAMGSLSVPIAGFFEDMEFTITLTGDSLLTSGLAEPKWHQLEIRAVQVDITAAGGEIRKSVKHFVLVYPKTFAVGEMKPGNNTERDIAFACRKIQTYIDGRETLNFDRINHIYRVNGKDFTKSIEAML